MVLSADEFEPMVRELMIAGAMTYVRKGIRPAELADVLHRAIRARPVCVCAAETPQPRSAWPKRTRAPGNLGAGRLNPSLAGRNAHTGSRTGPRVQFRQGPDNRERAPHKLSRRAVGLRVLWDVGSPTSQSTRYA